MVDPLNKPESQSVTVGVVTIGQSPRDDVLTEVVDRLPAGARIVQSGALDDLSLLELAALAARAGGDALVTRLRNGAEIVVPAAEITPLLQRAADHVLDQGARVVAVACSGSFEGLRSPVPVLFPGPLTRELAASQAAGGRIGVVVPDPDQAEMAQREWAGTARAVRVVAASPYGDTEAVTSAAAGLAAWHPDLVVLDCIGFSRTMGEAVRQIVKAPVLLPRTVLADRLAALIQTDHTSRGCIR
jgi:protein AroM